MRKFFSTISILIALCMLLSVSVYADAKLLKEYKEDDLLKAPGNAPKNDEAKTRVFEAGEVLEGDHPVWGMEIHGVDTDNGTKKFTAVVKITNINEGDDDDETPIFYIDPKMRTFEGENRVDAAPDQPYAITAGMIRDAKDEDGVKTFYYVIEPEVYAKADKLDIENRIRYNGEQVETGFELLSYALYEGELKPEDDPPAGNDDDNNGDDKGGDDKGKDDKGKDDKNVKTNDAGLMLTLVTAGAAAFGSLKLRKKN